MAEDLERCWLAMSPCRQETERPFAVGDRVVFTEPLFYPRPGEVSSPDVLGLWDTSSHKGFVFVKFDDEGMAQWVKPEHLRHEERKEATVEEKKRAWAATPTHDGDFRADDRVLYHNRFPGFSARRTFQHGKVTAIYPGELFPVRVTFDDSDRDGFDFEQRESSLRLESEYEAALAEEIAKREK